ncbi:MAG: hypothetical protein PUB37_05130 [Firmicutes bacterium]|nr:hypothetical protein [Bacillota bacterium]
MKVSKRVSIIANICLLLWFTLDMTGLYFGDKYLVARSYADDGIFFVIYAAAFALFLFKDKIGKIILSIWLAMWFVTQFMSHWWFTIFGGGEGKIQYFDGAVKIIESNNIYIPDLYHIVLHILILAAFVYTLLYRRADIKEN